jgi:hypothetical protein
VTRLSGAVQLQRAGITGGVTAAMPVQLHDQITIDVASAVTVILTDNQSTVALAETIIAHIKQFSSLNLPKHRLPLNAFLHLVAAITAYQINPVNPSSNSLQLIRLQSLPENSLSGLGRLLGGGMSSLIHTALYRDISTLSQPLLVTSLTRHFPCRVQLCDYAAAGFG